MCWGASGEFVWCVDCECRRLVVCRPGRELGQQQVESRHATARGLPRPTSLPLDRFRVLITSYARSVAVAGMRLMGTSQFGQVGRSIGPRRSPDLAQLSQPVKPYSSKSRTTLSPCCSCSCEEMSTADQLRAGKLTSIRTRQAQRADGYGMSRPSLVCPVA